MTRTNLPTADLRRSVRPAVGRGVRVWQISPRDRAILRLASEKLGGSTSDFGEALRALREAVEERIPAGRIYWLGDTADGPIVGSVLSGVGIVASTEGILVVQTTRDGQRQTLGRFAP